MTLLHALMHYLVTDVWHEVRRVNNWVVRLACQGGQDIG